MLQSERESSDAKLAKLKLQAKAKVTNLNKQIEELKKASDSRVNQDGSGDSSNKEKSKFQQENDKEKQKLEDIVSELTRQLQEKQENIGTLTKELDESQLTVTEFTRHLSDSQQTVTDLTRELHNSQETVRQLHIAQEKHETEILHLQRKLEEHVESLRSRTQVVEMMEQELQSAELQKQVLSEQYRQMEKELLSLKDTLDVAQEENMAQSSISKELLKEKDLICQRLQEELEQERTSKEKLQILKEELEMKHGFWDELSQLKEDIEREKGAHEVLEQMKEELMRVKGAQDELQRLDDELEVERNAHEMLEQVREKLDRVKGAQKTLQSIQNELEGEKAAQEMLEQVREELERVKGAQNELQTRRDELECTRETLKNLEELEKGRNVQDDCGKMREELERVNAARNDLEMMREELERQSSIWEDLERVQKELESGREAEEKLNQLKEELERQQAAQAELLKVKLELEKAREAQEELNLMKEELERFSGAKAELERVKQDLDKEGGDREDNEAVKEKPQSEMEDPDIQGRSTYMQEEVMVIEDGLVESVVEGDLEKAAQEEMANEKEDPENRLSLYQHSSSVSEMTTVCEELQMSSENSKLESGESISVSDISYILSSAESHQDFTEGHSVQVLQSYITKDIAVTMEGMKEKQLSILMVDINDAQEEIQKLKDQMTEERESNNDERSALTAEENNSVFTEIIQEASSTRIWKEQTEFHKEEEYSTISTSLQFSHSDQSAVITCISESEADVAINGVQEHETSDSKYDVSTSQCAACKGFNRDSEILLLQNMVADLKIQVTALASEKEVLAIKLQNQMHEPEFAEGQIGTGRDLKDIEELQMTNYESQNILKEQLNSLENESKSKDLKIAALQKDLDHLNLILSEQESLSRMQSKQLNEEASQVEKMQEILSHSQSKEERLSEVLAANECEIVSLRELLSQKSTQIETLQLSVQEKDQQVAEISHSFSDKMVLLNEEKYTMDKEIKALKAQLNSSNREQNEEMKELSEAVRKENTEMRIQLETILKEKYQLQETLELMQKEERELNGRIEVLQHTNIQDQETLKSVQEDRDMLETQVQAHLQKVNEHEELLIEMEALRHAHLLQQEMVQAQQKTQEELQDQLLVLTEKQRHSLEDLQHLQEEKSELESQLKFYLSQPLEEEKKDGSNEASELQQKLEHQRKDNEHLKKKLQAALVNRKELMKKVSELEKALAKDGEPLSSCDNSDADVLDIPKTQEQKMAEEFLKQQLSDRESELENAKKELVEKTAASELLQSRIDKLTVELNEKNKTIEFLNVDKMGNLSVTASPSPHPENTDLNASINQEHESNARVALENRIANLEQEKEILQKKIQDTLNSRRDTIKKAQEKDRHHREQLKQQKDEFNLLQEKYEVLQKNQNAQLGQLGFDQESEAHTVSQYTSGEPDKVHTSNKESEMQFQHTAFSEKNAQDSGWDNDWVEFSTAEVTDNLVDGTPNTEPTLESYKTQLNIFKTQKDELELRTTQIEEQLSQRLEEVAHLKDTVEQLTRQLDREKETNHESNTQAAILKAELENKLQETIHHLESEIMHIREELNTRYEEITNLNITLEENKEDLQNVQTSLLEKDNLIIALKVQLENQTKEFKDHSSRLEMQVLEVQQKQDEDIEEESKGKQQLQRKLQAALISRKEALKENKMLKSQLETVTTNNEELLKNLRTAESLLEQQSTEKDKLLERLSNQKGERDKLIAEVDKCLMENQNLAASCESLKLALAGVTTDKESLEKEFESMRLLETLQSSEWQEKLSELQKEYETLLQSYENVSDETDKMKRVLEAVKLEKQEVFGKLKSMEAAKRDVEAHVEELEQELEGMKEKMRKFAKSKQQKILELEEENERLRGELQPVSEGQKRRFDKAQSENAELKTELDRVHAETLDLTVQLELVKSEKASLEQQAEHLKLQLESVELKLQKTLEDSKSVSIQKEIFVQETASCQPDNLTEEQAAETSADKGTHLEISQKNEKLQNACQLEGLMADLENKSKKNEETIETMREEITVLKTEKINVERQLTVTQDQLSMLQEQIIELENKNQTAREEMIELQSKHERATSDVEEVMRQKQMLELEKDELEERLMNQLAELNGSIGNYQQDAMDLQIRNDNLQRELQDVRFQLEEEKRQLERQKAEALSQVQKEYVEKLKSVHDGEKGRKSQTKELQELLKEKQQEVRHLQKECIQYQETISGLERAIKALEFVHSESEKEKLASTEKLTKALDDTRQAKTDVKSLRILLDDSQSETARIAAENLKLKESLQAAGEETVLKLKRKEEDLEARLEQERDKHMKEMKNVQEKLDLMHLEKEKLQGSISSLQHDLDGKSVELKEKQDNLNQNIAKLAAFTRSMCSLQNDRDRIIEESKKWNKTFDDTMQKKDDEITEKEKTCVFLNTELKQVTAKVEELQVVLARLEVQNQELSATLKTETEASLKTRDALFEEKAILSSCLEEEQKLHTACQEELKLRNSEATERLNHLQAVELELKRLEAEREDLDGALKTSETEVQDWKLRCEQIQCDLQASKTLTEQLHRELEQKEQDVVRLLSARDEAVSTAVGELHELHAAESRALEERLVEGEKERRQLQERLESITSQLHSTKEEDSQSKAQLEAISKSMCSLQEERERLLSDYQQLEQRHIDAILAKDGLIQEAARESNELREELRFQRSHTDDLNAQNAKLNAELTRYREDLKELISLKDSQLKQLLGEKLQEIERMHHEQNIQEQQWKQDKDHMESLKKELEEVLLEKQRMQHEIETLTLSVSQLQSEIDASKLRLLEQEQEIQRQQEELSQLLKESADLKEENSRVKAEAEQRIQSAEMELDKKLKGIQHDTGILRNETETAEERVAELARDLIETEQHLLNVKEENSALTAQLHAFEGSMRSLQDSHDFAQEEIQRLRDQIKEMPIPQEDLSTVIAERDTLKDLVSQSREEQQQMQMQLEEQAHIIQIREAEVIRMTSELQSSQSNLQALSKAMGSLQEEHGHLKEHIQRPYMEVERTLQSPDIRDRKESNPAGKDPLHAELQSIKEELQQLHSQLTDALAQVHHKELRIHQLNGKLSHIFEEKNALSLQLRGSSQNLRDALNRNASLERQLQELQPMTQEVLQSNSSAAVSHEKMEYQTRGDRQIMELQQRYLEMEQMNSEAEHTRMELEQQLREERRRAEEREQELENMKRLQPCDWSVSQDPDVTNDLSLLIEPENVLKGKVSKTRSTSLRRQLRNTFFSRTRTPMLAALYILIIHVLLLLCFTGHL
ncbi:Hypothetical predicted protein [Pelobates cultripes]|uniref:Golgin subfamily B member 1 n=1 Tax=Pelobates cultripes TaxID=61616 RepID=A0AAD1VYJ0_PELCU|nr:Hypothetical predicted protein [Pelobates cultripes]